jgi:hypothetical protein
VIELATVLLCAVESAVALAWRDAAPEDRPAAVARRLAGRARTRYWRMETR